MNTRPARSSTTGTDLSPSVTVDTGMQSLNVRSVSSWVRSVISKSNKKMKNDSGEEILVVVCAWCLVPSHLSMASVSRRGLAVRR